MTEFKTVTGYQYVTITGASGGFGEFDARYGQDGDVYADTSDLIAECNPDGYVSTEQIDWADDEDTELVDLINDMTGNIHYEPQILVAMRQTIGNHPQEIVTFGINPVECYVRRDNGEYEPVGRYTPDRQRYLTADE